MDTPTVLVADADDGVTLLTLNRPGELNAWTYELEAELFGALDAAAAAPEVRVVVLTGAGRGFCAGASMELLRRRQHVRARDARPDRPGQAHRGDGRARHRRSGADLHVLHRHGAGQPA
ncbi:enoyl-CoA hydratase-related protein [Streptosporangium sp. NPDC001681]|uniref:enoyl-CoA hydratase-related protein n=1 Tax=Streptosporangium sp. NPDC001681 TaxID=3154395 RepID=UPI003318DC49